MKTDPNKGCANLEERLFWALAHDGIAHPLMALSGYAAWALRFHNFTSRKAWPRCAARPAAFTAAPEDQAALDVLREHFRANKIPCVIEGRPSSAGYEYRVRRL